MGKADRGFNVTVEGTYYAPSPVLGKKAIKPYVIQVILPDMDCALSIIKNKLLNKVIIKSYPDYAGYRTYSITNVENLDGTPASLKDLSVREMNSEQIAEYVADKHLPVEIDAFPDLNDLRDAVRLAETDPEAFLVRQTEAKKDLKLNASLENLNPGLNATEKETKAETTTLLEDDESNANQL